MNVSTVKQEKQEAQLMTEEIDRLTDVMTGNVPMENPDSGVNRGQMGGLGNKVLTYNPDGQMSGVGVEQVGVIDKTRQQVGYSDGARQQEGVFDKTGQQMGVFEQAKQRAENAEIVREIAGVDNGYSPEVAANPDKVGEETRLQERERTAEDREDIENEQGLNGKYVKSLMDRNNKRITKETVAVVDRIISKNEYHPAQLELLMTRSRTNFLKDVFNRILGSRN